MLAAAQVPLEELTSLTGGRTPTAEIIDALGFWRPSSRWPHNHYSWLIPLTEGIFLEASHWYRGAELTADPQRFLSAKEIAELVRATPRLQPQEPAPPAKPADF
jgi:hypothetical protein